MYPFHGKRTLLLASVARPVPPYPGRTGHHRIDGTAEIPIEFSMRSWRLIRADHTSPQAICGKETSCLTF